MFGYISSATKIDEIKFKNIAFPNDPIHYIAPTYDDMNHITFLLAKQMRANGITADRIVTLAKGGWPMTRSLVDFTKIKEVASIGVKFYQKLNQRYEVPKIYQDLPVSVKGESVILFDDVADTGKSLVYVKDYLLKAGVKQVTTVTLFYKSHSVIKPDFYGPTTAAWIVFPYESRESFSFFQRKWTKEGLSNEEIDSRMKQFGARQAWLDEYRLFS